MRPGARLAGCLLLVLLWGCASRQDQKAEIAAAHQAGQEAAFDLLQQSGIGVVRMEGPFQRRVILWQDGMTLARALVQAGYQPAEAPARILLRQGREVDWVDSARLLAGEEVPLQPGAVVHVEP